LQSFTNQKARSSALLTFGTLFNLDFPSKSLLAFPHILYPFILYILAMLSYCTLSQIQVGYINSFYNSSHKVFILFLSVFFIFFYKTLVLLTEYFPISIRSPSISRAVCTKKNKEKKRKTIVTFQCHREDIKCVCFKSMPVGAN